jgi:hypothetical protein
MSQKYPGGFITKSPVAPTSSAASGMWTIDQAMQLQKQGLWPSPPPAIGAAYGGGFFAGQISTAGNGIADYNLVIGPVASAQSQLQWKTTDTSTAGTSSVIDGPANSAAMNDASHPAAQFCEGRTIGGFSDWYMPAKNELEICYFSFKPDTSSNVTSSGANVNAVPARASNYTSGTPARTSVVAYQMGNAQAFDTGQYWSSTQQSSTNGWVQLFFDGDQYGFQKGLYRRVRAVRRVAV